MIAKGLDLPKLRAVGVVQADAGLSLPDFSASGTDLPTARTGNWCKPLLTPYIGSHSKLSFRCGGSALWYRSRLHLNTI